MKKSPNRYVAGNWKMNLDLNEGMSLVEDILSREIDPFTMLILAPSFVHLPSVGALIMNKENIFLAAQNCHQLLKGAHTGEISVSILKSVGVEYIILGHSERRQDNVETNELLKQKVDTVLNEGLKIIFCCGESLDIRNKGEETEFVINQLESSIGHLNDENMASVIIAYEPIWAIGTGVTASSAQAQAMHGNIRNWLIKKFQDVGYTTAILYGGSCKPTNAKDLFSKQDINGGLIGGCSLNAEDFVGIANSF